ncbi:hypothetical protein ACFQZ4_45685 [Catellatospora coxensis]
MTSGDDAAFSETVEVDGGAAGGTYHCEVDFLIDGTSRGYVQTLTVHVPGLSVYDVQVNEEPAPSTSPSPCPCPPRSR